MAQSGPVFWSLYHGTQAEVWFAQTITPSASKWYAPPGYITAVWLNQITAHAGTYSGTVDVHIRLADASGPSGGNKCNGHLDWNWVAPQTTSTTTLKIPILGGINLLEGVQYAIVVHMTINLPQDSPTALFLIVTDVSTSELSGKMWESCDAGVTWHAYLLPDQPTTIAHSCGYAGSFERDMEFTLFTQATVPPSAPPDDLPDFPADRPDGYTPDDFWIPGKWDGDTYTPPEWGPPTNGRYFATGGGRWGLQLVAVGHGLIYYEELT